MDIICVATPSWEGNYTKSTVELIKCMAQRHRVLYIDYSYTCKDMLTGIFKKSTVPVKRMMGFQKRLRQVQGANDSQLWLLTLPPILPANFIKNKKIYTFFQRINSFVIRRSILKASKKLNFSQPVVINAWHPFVGNFLYGKLNERLTIYYCIDEINEGPWTKEHGVYLETMFLKKVDAAVVTSQGLFHTRAPIARNCFLVQNGVDFELFRHGFSFPKEAPVVIGFVGTIASRIDFEILEAIAEHFPSAKLVIVGRVAFDGRPVDEEVARLKRYSNVEFTGAQPAEKLPDYLKTFHLGIIPNIKNAQTAAVYPMKINEYLAAGIPVVTTDFAPLDEFLDVITVAHSTAEFIQGIEHELTSDNDQKRIARQELAKNNSWDNRALIFEKIVENLLTENHISTYKQTET